MNSPSPPLNAKWERGPGRIPGPGWRCLKRLPVTKGTHSSNSPSAPEQQSREKWGAKAAGKGPHTPRSLGSWKDPASHGWVWATRKQQVWTPLQFYPEGLTAHTSDSRPSWPERVWGSEKKLCVMVEVLPGLPKNWGSTWHTSLVYTLPANLTNWHRRHGDVARSLWGQGPCSLLPTWELLRSRSLEEVVRRVLVRGDALATANETRAKPASLKHRRWLGCWEICPRWERACAPQEKWRINPAQPRWLEEEQGFSSSTPADRDT